MAEPLIVQPTGSRDSGPCDCCGHESRCVWGEVYDSQRCVAVSYVHWTLGGVPTHGANIDLMLGQWGEQASPADRHAVALAYRVVDGGPSMMVIDAANIRPLRTLTLIGRLMRREGVIGTPAAVEAFAVADAVMIHDRRIEEVLCGWRWDV